MLFRRDDGQERSIWVDRGIDGRVDNFKLCEPCNKRINETDPLGERWHSLESGVCPKCRVDFQAHAMAVDLFGLPRPFNGMLDDRVLTNDELEANQRSPIPGAFEYFLPDPGDYFQPGQNDRLLSEPGDRFQPDSGDFFLPGPGDAFRPGQGDDFLPDPGGYLLPDLEGRFMSE